MIAPQAGERGGVVRGMERELPGYRALRAELAALRVEVERQKKTREAAGRAGPGRVRLYRSQLRTRTYTAGGCYYEAPVPSRASHFVHL